jgi:Cof subfamily protein (haloacid dehalogenase superfamily)
MELIVFDLDGTLLNESSQISPFTRETLALLTERGIAYTVATGRTQHSAQHIILGQGFHLPHVYTNGVMIWDPHFETLSLEAPLTVAETAHVLHATHNQGISAFISTVTVNSKHQVFHPQVKTPIEQQLLNEYLARANIEVLPIEAMPGDSQITNIGMLGASSDIDAIRYSIHNEAHLIAYSGPALEKNDLHWMDIHHSGASKGGAIMLLAEKLSVEKVICFGDSDNDLSMFAIADECYAPENAKNAVKLAATGVIGHHNADGIAHYLRQRYRLV